MHFYSGDVREPSLENQHSAFFPQIPSVLVFIAPWLLTEVTH